MPAPTAPSKPSQPGTLFLIRKAPNSNLYLEDFDGKKYNWTTDRKTAWSFNFVRGGARLYLVSKTTSTAVLTSR